MYWVTVPDDDKAPTNVMNDFYEAQSAFALMALMASDAITDSRWFL